jgi:hypothetical protein
VPPPTAAAAAATCPPRRWAVTSRPCENIWVGPSPVAATLASWGSPTLIVSPAAGKVQEQKKAHTRREQLLLKLPPVFISGSSCHQHYSPQTQCRRRPCLTGKCVFACEKLLRRLQKYETAPECDSDQLMEFTCFRGKNLSKLKVRPTLGRKVHVAKHLKRPMI